VDRYDTIGQRAKFAAKFSYFFLLLLGIGTVVAATLVGAGAFHREAAAAAIAASSAGNTSSLAKSSDNGDDAAGTSSISSIIESMPQGDLVAFVLAVFSSFCGSYIAYVNPVKRWRELKTASLSLRSEIFRFRTRTGQYDMKVNTRNVMVMREAVSSLRARTLASAGIGQSTIFTKYPKSAFRHGQYIGFDPPAREGAGILPRMINPTVMLPPLSSGTPARETAVSVSPEEHTERVIDNFHSPLDATAFIALRLEPMIRFYQSRLYPYWFGKTTGAVFIMLTTAASALMSAFGLTVWVGILAIAASSATSWLEFSGVESKLERYNQAIVKLRDIRLWWETLTPVEHSSAFNVTTLVNSVEDVIANDTKAWMATSMAAKNLTKAAAAAKGESE
jgi:hypothetical protein